MDFPNYHQYVTVVSQQSLWLLILGGLSAVIVIDLAVLRVWYPKWLRMVRPFIVALFVVSLILQIIGV